MQTCVPAPVTPNAERAFVTPKSLLAASSSAWTAKFGSTRITPAWCAIALIWPSVRLATNPSIRLNVVETCPSPTARRAFAIVARSSNVTTTSYRNGPLPRATVWSSTSAMWLWSTSPRVVCGGLGDFAAGACGERARAGWVVRADVISPTAANANTARERIVTPSTPRPRRMPRGSVAREGPVSDRPMGCAWACPSVWAGWPTWASRHPGVYALFDLAQADHELLHHRDRHGRVL